MHRFFLPRFLPIVIAASLLTARDAQAQAASDSPARSEALADAEVTRRIDWLQARLDGGTAAANRWWLGWYVGFTALTTAQAVAAVVTTNDDLRVDAAVGAVSSSLGVIPLGLFPLPARTAAATLQAMAGTTPEQRRRKLARGERLLRVSADAETLGRSWLAHLLAGTVALGSGLVLALAYDHHETGVLTGIAGLAVGELQILTSPTAAIDDWKEYSKAGGRNGAWHTAPSPRTSATPAWSLSIVPAAGGLGVAGRF